MAHKWLIVGAGGMLGRDLVADLTRHGCQVTASRSADLDIRDACACREGVKGFDVVVNAAAWTAVDDAEAAEAHAFSLNAVGAANLARAARAADARLVHISTDYVFDGQARDPYPVDAVVAPRSAYGRTKAAGEWAVQASNPDALVVRTAWLYGAHGPNFVRTMLGLAKRHDTVAVVDDQRGQPTWTVDLADLIRRLVHGHTPGGIWHGTSGGEVSWYDFCRAIFAGAGLDPERVTPTTSASFVRPAPRPAYSVLSHERFVGSGIEPIRSWERALAAALPTLLG